MVATEKAFSAATALLGVKEGFLTFVSPKAISFDAELQNACEKLQKKKPTTYPVEVSLQWTPESGGIAKSGDFGYLYGPWQYTTISTGFVSARGKYISIWKKYDKGLWKVAFDCGVETKDRDIDLTKQHFISQDDSTEFAARKSSDTSKAKESLLKAEVLFAKLNGVNSPAAADTILSGNLTLFRDDMLPLVGKSESGDWYKVMKTASFRIAGFDISASRDVAYTYGTCGIEMQKFYFLHIWRTNSMGEWKLVVDVTSKF